MPRRGPYAGDGDHGPRNYGSPRLQNQDQAGSNQNLPYPDAYFDLLLSVNTLHYEGTEENFLAALHEFRRVIKPGGGFVYLDGGPGARDLPPC